MLQKKDIIITSLQSWHIPIGSNCKNIAGEFSRNHRVLYVNPPLSLKDSFKRSFGKIHSTEAGIVFKVNDNLYTYTPKTLMLPINQLPFKRLFDKLNRWNNKRMAIELEKVKKLVGFGKHIHFCDSDMFRSFYLKELLQPEQFIYYSRDNLLAVDYWKRNGKRIEPLLMQKADMVLTNSTYLKDLAQKQNKNSFYVGQGCDIQHYLKQTKKSIPDDIASIPEPRIGYVGSLNGLRLDISLIHTLALKQPNWNIVLVGPEDKEFQKSNLHHVKNIHFLGAKSPDELPGYIKGFNVAINPQIINDVTIGNYPRKIDEYLAVGVPVVATKTKAMQIFDGYVSLAGSVDNWNLLITNELRHNNELKIKNRQCIANMHSWENNVKEIYKRIESHEYQV